MSKSETPASTPATPNKPDAARRALLRGVAVGIPSVVTLASGSAWGAQGSVPCFNAVYSGKFSANGAGKLKWDVDIPPRITKNAYVTQANTSEFCWNSGTPPVPWNQLPP